MENKIFIGVDIGGTKIMTGAINENGVVLCEPCKVPTDSSEPSEMIVKRITDSIEYIIEKLNVGIDDVQGIGIGTTGPLDIKKGVILECPQLPTMHFFPLLKAIREYFNIPVYINNDANCLIYGEAIFGAGYQKDSIVGFTLGTGIGCAIVIDRKILNGSTGTAGEVWISSYQSGIIEDYVSGDGVTKIYESISGQTKSSLEVLNLAEQGDANAIATWKEFGKHLAVAIAWAINLIDPELVILGGSISNAHKFFGPDMEIKLRKHICPVPAVKTRVTTAELGDNAGFIGAACLVLENN